MIYDPLYDTSTFMSELDDDGESEELFEEDDLAADELVGPLEEDPDELNPEFDDDN